MHTPPQEGRALGVATEQNKSQTVTIVGERDSTLSFGKKKRERSQRLGALLWQGLWPRGGQPSGRRYAGPGPGHGEALPLTPSNSLVPCAGVTARLRRGAGHPGFQTRTRRRSAP